MLVGKVDGSRRAGAAPQQKSSDFESQQNVSGAAERLGSLSGESPDVEASVSILVLSLLTVEHKVDSIPSIS